MNRREDDLFIGILKGLGEALQVAGKVIQVENEFRRPKTVFTVETSTVKLGQRPFSQPSPVVIRETKVVRPVVVHETKIVQETSTKVTYGELSVLEDAAKDYGITMYSLMTHAYQDIVLKREGLTWKIISIHLDGTKMTRDFSWSSDKDGLLEEEARFRKQRGISMRQTSINAIFL